MKAADIDDADIMSRIRDEAGPRKEWVYVWDAERWYPGLPRKVVVTKLRQLARRGLIDGCFCGCRGDIEITSKGDEFLCEKPTP